MMCIENQVCLFRLLVSFVQFYHVCDLSDLSKWEKCFIQVPIGILVPSDIKEVQENAISSVIL
jgi:hypothetical protein